MANVYACPVHVDQQGNEPNRVCPVCGQRSILLRGDPSAQEPALLQPEADKVASVGEDGERAEAPQQQAKGAAQASSKKAGKAAAKGGKTAVPETGAALGGAVAAKLDQIIALLSQIRDRLGSVK